MPQQLRYVSPRFASLLLATAVFMAACVQDTPPHSDPAMAEAERPALRTKADSVAMVLYDSLGGPAAWASVPYLRFNFGIDRGGEHQVFNRHLWNRTTGDYRLEWTQGEDSSYVALFNINTQDGNVYLNGTPVDSTRRDELLARAYRSFINDTYWLLAPVKVFDSGVTRTYVADSSDARHDVIRLTFQDVGLTPGDTYWLFVDKNTGRLARWTMVLQGDTDVPPRGNTWEAYERHEVPGGSVQVATRKPGRTGDVAIVTDEVEMPSDVPAELFTDPNPRL